MNSAVEDSSEAIVVEVEDDPRARQPVPRPVRAGVWVVVALVVIAGLVAVLVGRPEPSWSYEQPVVRGLTETPSFVWQVELDETHAVGALG